MIFLYNDSTWDKPGSFTDKIIGIERYFADLFKENVYYSSKILLIDYSTDDRLLRCLQF